MKTEELYLNIINNLSDGVYFVDYERRITFWNKAAEIITGYTADEIIGRKCDDNILNHIDAEGRPLCTVGCPLYTAMLEGGQTKAEVFLRHKTGYRVPVFVNIFPMTEDGAVIGAIEIFTPNSPIVYEDSLIEKLSEMAMQDHLTGLPNRRYLQSFMEYRVNEFRRFQTLCAVLFMDIDNFRQLNNTYGHETGDLVLKNLSKTIQSNLRKSDLFGRWGGEEFVGVFSVKTEREAVVLAEKIRVLAANTQIMHSEPLSVSVSVGITVVTAEDNPETAVMRADQLMYKSKVLGKNRVSTDIRKES